MTFWALPLPPDTSVLLCSDSSASSLCLARALRFGNAAAAGLCFPATAASAAPTVAGQPPLPPLPVVAAGKALGTAAAAGVDAALATGLSFRPGSCTASNRPLACSRAARRILRDFHYLLQAQRQECDAQPW